MSPSVKISVMCYNEPQCGNSSLHIKCTVSPPCVKILVEISTAVGTDYDLVPEAKADSSCVT